MGAADGARVPRVPAVWGISTGAAQAPPAGTPGTAPDAAPWCTHTGTRAPERARASVMGSMPKGGARCPVSAVTLPRMARRPTPERMSEASAILRAHAGGVPFNVGALVRAAATVLCELRARERDDERRREARRELARRRDAAHEAYRKPCKRYRLECGARCRSKYGEPCKAKVCIRVRPDGTRYASTRCRLHGGLSTGPRTAEGRARCGEAGRRARAAERTARAIGAAHAVTPPTAPMMYYPPGVWPTLRPLGPIPAPSTQPPVPQAPPTQPQTPQSAKWPLVPDWTARRR